MVRLAMVPRSPLRPMLLPLSFLERSLARVALVAHAARRWGGKVTFSLLLSGAVACGHPASEAECQTIVERIVDLELQAQKVTDPNEIAKRRSESLGGGDAGRSEMLVGCIGKHVTDKAMACVRAAGTAAEITDRCLQ